MKVGICDFPSRYAFPPFGYGGIERWLWAAALGAHQSGATVTLLGPAWRDDLQPRFHRISARFEDMSRDGEIFRLVERLKLDLLIVGHEYPSHPAWRAIHAALGCEVATFQHDATFQHATNAFNGRTIRLHCYSTEMIERYRKHRPIQCLSVQFGLGEHKPGPAIQGQDLMWIGRVDKDKAPHLAAMAAARLRERIRIIGPINKTYFEQHRATLTAPHVELVGELAGSSKLAALSSARTLVYTCSPDYIEAGAAVFGEALRCGTPVAATAWRSGTCAQSALCDETGTLAEILSNDSDHDLATALADAIDAAATLDHRRVQKIGLDRFNPTRHFQALSYNPCR